MRGPKPVAVELTENERVTLVQWARRRKTAQALAQRSRIILACAQGGSNTEIAAQFGTGAGYGGEVAVAVCGPPAGRG
jgi:hypothetical protein